MHALFEILRRHEAWRTNFTAESGQFVQLIQAPRTISIPVLDLRALPPATRESEALRLAGEETRRPFNVTRGPLLRFKLIRVTDTEHWLVLIVHHIVSDTQSIYGTFLPELVTLYEAFAADKASLLPELPLQYADFAEWQRASWQEGRWTDQMAFWRQQLSGCLFGP